ncbi:hypothetical protein BDM02DRAFT_3182294 [Thelephora ganbajun]|uniref:Uncharacterized protein n=1 Tax=Thelephora ganbajun TaxID=370292 RepID=A0ACB6ZWI4_THEGA|nr:hypothetical protein BDM02DRAFT_3182294 [Thelephora ganbajun]
MTATTAVAVYCGSSPGKQRAYQHAADSLGKALAAAKRQLVYGGGSKGIMGIVSGAVLDAGGDVIGVIPHAMLAVGGEGERVSGDDSTPVLVKSKEERMERVEWVIVNSMHERKVEMARRSSGFIGLPGGFGTFEEVLEVTTWTQIGIHSKPVVLANVLGFFDPLRALIQNGIEGGFIRPAGINLIKFVDGPSDHALHESFDWGKVLLEEIDSWKGDPSYNLGYDWTRPRDGGVKTEALDAT